MKITNRKKPNIAKTSHWVDLTGKSLGYLLGMVFVNCLVLPFISNYLAIRSYIEQKPMSLED